MNFQKCALEACGSGCPPEKVVARQHVNSTIYADEDVTGARGDDSGRRGAQGGGRFTAEMSEKKRPPRTPQGCLVALGDARFIAVAYTANAALLCAAFAALRAARAPLGRVWAVRGVVG